MKSRDDFNTETPYPLAKVLRRVFEHGNQTKVALATNIKVQAMHEMLAERKRNPLDFVRVMYEALVAQANPLADEIILELNRACGFVAYKTTGAVGSVRLGKVLEEVSDVLRERSLAETDNLITAEEHRGVAAQYQELIEAAVAARDEELRQAEEKAARLGIRRVS